MSRKGEFPAVNSSFPSLTCCIKLVPLLPVWKFFAVMGRLASLWLILCLPMFKEGLGSKDRVLLTPVGDRWHHLGSPRVTSPVCAFCALPLKFIYK